MIYGTSQVYLLDLPRPFLDGQTSLAVLHLGPVCDRFSCKRYIVFATVVDNMGKESLHGLKVTLCITPILLLLLLNTTTDV